MILNIRPLTWHWSEWRERFTQYDEVLRPLRDRLKIGEVADPNDIVALGLAVGAQQRETDAWLSALSAEKRQDVIDLLRAECDMLYNTIDPDLSKYAAGAKAPVVGSWSFVDFRERWYIAIVLAEAVVRVGFEGGDGALRAYRNLEFFAEEKAWLP